MPGFPAVRAPRMQPSRVQLVTGSTRSSKRDLDMSAWGAPPTTGAWAAQVDEEEEENGGDLAPVPAAAAKAFPTPGAVMEFPSLGETAASKETKKDRKKRQQKMTLGAFVAAGRKEPEVVHLPTAPRTRGDEEEGKRDGLGGGFRNYGGDRGGGFGDRDDDRGFGRLEDDGPSRADAAGDWGTKKAFVPSAPSRGGFGSREGGFGDRDRGGFEDRFTEQRSGFGEGDLNRADDADRWESKSFEPSARRGMSDERPSSFGGPTRADSEDRWSRRAPQAETPGDSQWGTGSLSTASSGSRPRLSLKPRSADLPPVPRPPSAPASEAGSEDTRPEQLVVPRTGPRANPFGSAKPVAVKEPVELTRSDSKYSQSSEPEAAQAAAPRPRANPFGSARPREEVLREKGIDIDKIGPSSRASEASRSGASTPRTGGFGAAAGGNSSSTNFDRESASALAASFSTNLELDEQQRMSDKHHITSSKEAENLPVARENGVSPTDESAADANPAGSWARVASKPADSLGAAQEED